MTTLVVNYSWYWAKDAQVDEVAINWREQTILPGACKWGMSSVVRAVIRQLVDKAPRLIPAKGWQVHFIFFARRGFTEAAQAEAELVGAQLVDLVTLNADLANG